MINESYTYTDRSQHFRQENRGVLQWTHQFLQDARQLTNATE